MCVLPSEMIILAGGLGTRLKPVVSNIPKPMAPIMERPFLAYILDHWIGQGIRRFVISTGYLSSVIETYFGKSYRYASITYVHEQQPLGTGGAICLAQHAITSTNTLTLVANGDTWFPIQLKKFHADALTLAAPITIGLKKLKNNDRYSGVILGSQGQITSFGENAISGALINAGCYLFEFASLKNSLNSMPNAFSLEKDFMPAFASTAIIGSSIHSEPFLDIGVPEDYQRASDFLTINGK